MFCNKCGKKIDEGASICPYCGAAAEANPAAGPLESAWDPVPASSEASSPVITEGSSRKGFGIIAAIGGVAVVAIAAAIVLFSGLLGGAKAELGKAVLKSVNAFADASEAAGLPDMQALTKEQKVTQVLSLELKSLSNELTASNPELTALQGVGIQFSEGLDLPGRKLDLEAVLSYDGDDLLTFRMGADDEVMTLDAPEFLGGRTFGLNTTTLGRDLSRFDASIPEDMGFNFFDLMEPYASTAEMEEAIRKASKDLAEAAEVEKTGKTTATVNGASLDAAAYRVTVSETAMKDFLDAMEDAYKSCGAGGAMADFMRGMGVSEEDLQEMEASIDGSQMFDALDQLAEAAGDIELNVCVALGYVVSVEWSEEIEDAGVSLNLYFGGGRNYADDLSAELCLDDTRFHWTSTGNHGTEAGTYTDKTTIRVQDGSDTFLLNSELEYDPEASDNNFAWTLQSEGIVLAIEGQLDTGKTSMNLDIDKLAVSSMGIELVRLGGGYSLKPYEAPAWDTGTPTMLADMGEDDFLTLYDEVPANAQSWLMNLMTSHPDLLQLFY